MFVAVLGCTSPAAAQSAERFTVESVFSIDAFSGENVNDRPQIVVDVSAAMRVGDNWQLIFRPWFRLPRPNSPTGAAVPWEKELYQAGVRYERRGRIATRFDAGYIVSPVGLGMFDSLADLNPTILPHLGYRVSMPVFDPTGPRAVPVASSYPLGANVTVSTSRWDARAAVVSSTPTRSYGIGRDSNPRHTPSVVAGAGVTPTIGLRLGGSVAYGKYATREELTRPLSDGRTMTLTSAEGEYAFRYTKISGEVVRTAFEASTAPAIAYQWFVQGVQTLSPRWFAAARHEGVSAPPLCCGIVAGRRTTFTVAEATGGYRATPDITVRGSYVARRSYTATAWDHQIGVSLVLARRW